MSGFGLEPSISDFTAADLVARVESLPPEAIHALPFGAVKLDPRGKVVFFSRTEAAQSGFGPRVAIGRAFFTELAPCIGKPEFLGRIERAMVDGTLDVTFEHIGDFEDAERELTVRVASAKGGGVWLFLQRHSGRRETSRA